MATAESNEQSRSVLHTNSAVTIENAPNWVNNWPGLAVAPAAGAGGAVTPSSHCPCTIIFQWGVMRQGGPSGHGGTIPPPAPLGRLPPPGSVLGGGRLSLTQGRRHIASN